ncbi:MAG: Cys-tRNA(Pro) deacylase [Gammaproteobacteria bacterium]|nr:MAG: Cys-tRNA(Pro) deacylase [Gammaproteobacteria bacterium]
MTPAITLAKQKKLDYKIHEYTHDAAAASYGLEAAEKLGIPSTQVFKTLVVTDDKGKLAVAILPVNKKLNLKKIAKAIGAKKTNMADPQLVEKNTGYVLGGVSPLGQKKRLTTVIHTSAKIQKTIYVSAGKRGLEIELPPMQLVEVLSAKFADVVQQ